MKEKLNLLFDYQKFEQNERLAQIIKSAEQDSKVKKFELSDDVLSTVYAAGDPGAGNIPQTSGLFPENTDENS